MKQLLFIIALTTSMAPIYGQKQENLRIVWAEEYKWKIVSNQENQSMHMLEMVPENETGDNWKIIGTMISYKNTKISRTDQVVEIYKQDSEKESSKAKVTILESDDKGKNIWVLFKVETPSFPNDPNPESQLYYAIQGEKTLYVNFIAIKEKKLFKEFVDKWSIVFKNSEIVYQ